MYFFSIGNPIVWKFVREEWPNLVNRFSLNDRYLGRLPSYIASGFNTKLELEELNAFFAKYPDAGAGKLLSTSSINLQINEYKYQYTF